MKEHTLRQIEKYPVYSYIPRICGALDENNFVVVTAQTGAGKSTILPVGLMEHFSGKIIMTEPRRLAVLGAAERISSLLEEQCGESAGYRIHLEKKVSEATRLEVVTEAVLLRMLQDDEALEQYSVVVLDEFHERSVNVDLALAFLKEACVLHEDLKVVVMSATLDACRISEYLDGCPVVDVPGRTFPVDVEYAEGLSVCRAVERSVESMGYGQTVLAFLPGISEIRKCVSELQEVFGGRQDIELDFLHSSVTVEEQRRVLVPVEKYKKRIVVSSAIAETSITIPDVFVVVDSGLCRVNQMNLSTGMSELVTRSESQFSAVQRTGRAGRTGPGKCIRLWNEFDLRPKELPCEMLRTDLSEVVLECMSRGIREADKLKWLDPPSDSAWKTSLQLLEMLGLVNEGKTVTSKGRAALSLGQGPRLASLALDGKNCGGEQLVLMYSQYSESAPYVQKKFLEDLDRRLKNCGYENERPVEKSLLVLSGFPDRVARRISCDGVVPVEVQFVNGKKAVVKDEKFSGGRWICAPVVNGGREKAVVYSYEVLDGNAFDLWLEQHLEKKSECRFENGKVCRYENLCLGELVVKSVKGQAAPEDFSAAWCSEVKSKGLECLPLDAKTKMFLVRTRFCFQARKDCVLEKKYKGLCENAGEWLVPFLGGVSSLTSGTVYNALYWYLEGSMVDEYVPEKIVLANGRNVKVKYESDGEKIVPVVEIIIQRIFGCFETPCVCGVPVLLKLLSPASRPLQITTDLSNFWKETWPQVCREMKGRYPKHNWDYTVVQED